MVDMATVATCLVLGADPSLIGAIIEVESQWTETAFNVNKWDGENYQNDDVDQAAAAVEVFLSNGYTVDVGLMQINSENLKKYNVNVLDGFDVCTNVRLGERILTDAIDHAVADGLDGNNAIKAALSIYNTGNITYGFKNGYADKVWSVYHDKGEQASLFSDTQVDLSTSADLFDYSHSLSVGVERGNE